LMFVIRKQHRFSVKIDVILLPATSVFGKTDVDKKIYDSFFL